MEKDIELEKAIGKAATFPGDKPPGIYIGCRKTKRTTYYYYKDGSAYWLETAYDREIRNKEEEKKQRKCREYDRYMRQRYGWQEK